MNFGHLKTTDFKTFKSKNKRVTIVLSERGGHMHVSFFGIYRKSGWTSVKPCNRLERAILANYLLKRLANEGYLSTQDLNCLNYAEVFTSLWPLDLKGDIQ